MSAEPESLPPTAVGPTPALDPDASRYDAPTDPDASRYETPSLVGRRGDPNLPRRFAGYQLLAEIARGGMGVVYKAHQLGPDGRPLRLVALKMILGGSQASHESTQRFWTEARAAAGLNHPGIVPVVEAGDHEGQPFYSMEYVEGGSLADRVKEGGPLPPREAARLVQQVAEAVQAAHDQGIVHRDIKPHNILLASGGCQPPDSSPTGSSHASLARMTARLTDFGLARTREGGGSMTGEKLGTPSYMAPEQAAGNVHAVSAATDVYGLGAVLYCVLTGRPPFQSSSPLETMRLVLEQEPVAVRQLNPAVPRDLETVCHQCLQKESGKRYPTAGALVTEMGRFLAGEPVRARPVGRLERGWRWCKRKPVVAGLLTAVVLLLATGTALVTWQWQKAERARTRAEAAESDLEREGKELLKAINTLKASKEALDRQDSELAMEKGQIDSLKQEVDQKASRLEAVARHSKEDKNKEDRMAASLRQETAHLEALAKRLKEEKRRLDSRRLHLMREKQAIEAARKVLPRNIPVVQRFKRRVESYNIEAQRFSAFRRNYAREAAKQKRQEDALRRQTEDYERLRAALKARRRELQVGYREHRSAIKDYNRLLDALRQRMARFQSALSKHERAVANLQARLGKYNAKATAATGSKGPRITSDETLPKGGTNSRPRSPQSDHQP